MKKYFLYDGATQYGPFDLTELETKIITPQTMVWYETLPEWKPAGEIDELKQLLNSKVPAANILTPPTVQPREEDWSNKQYYYTDNQGQQGPVSLDELKRRSINKNTHVWYDPLPEWTTAGKVSGLKDVISGVSTDSTAVQTEEKKRSQYYYLDSKSQKYGPYTYEQLQEKSITMSTLIWYDPLPDWIKAGNEESLRNVITKTQPISHGGAVQNKLYYYLDASGQKQGPYTIDELNGKPVSASTFIWYDPLPNWIKAGEELSLNILGSAQPGRTARNTRTFYYYIDSAGRQQGPFTSEQLQGKPITASTMIWYDSLPKWINAGSDDSLRNILGNGSNGVDWSKKLFYYTDAAGQQGPFTLEQLRGKPITSATPVWYDPLPQWTTAGQVEGLKEIAR